MCIYGSGCMSPWPSGTYLQRGEPPHCSCSLHRAPARLDGGSPEGARRAPLTRSPTRIIRRSGTGRQSRPAPAVGPLAATDPRASGAPRARPRGPGRTQVTEPPGDALQGSLPRMLGAARAPRLRDGTSGLVGLQDQRAVGERPVDLLVQEADVHERIGLHRHLQPFDSAPIVIRSVSYSSVSPASSAPRAATASSKEARGAVIAMTSPALSPDRTSVIRKRLLGADWTSQP